MLPTFSSHDLGHPTEPGPYPFGGGEVQVERRHISAWSTDPETTFRGILCSRLGDTTLRFALGEPAPRD